MRGNRFHRFIPAGQLVPTLRAGFDPGQSQFMGRLMLVTLLKLLSLMVTLAFAAIPAIAIHKVIEGPGELAALSTTPVLAAFALLFTWLVGRSFQSFDVSKDIPT